ncbi:MAG: hypothetical protein ABI999_12335 [Acidobacteriota bacterium]
MFVRKNFLAAVALLIVGMVGGVFAQDATTPSPSPTPTASPTPADLKKAPKPTPAPKIDPSKPLTAEQVVESAIVITAFPGGRATLNQIRKTTIEKGKTSLTGADGHVDPVSYERWIIRADTLDKEKIRFDQEFPNAKFSLFRSGEKVMGLYNEQAFTPRADASKAFESQTFHGLEALLRYKEDGSKIELGGRDKIMAVDLYFIDLTDKQGRKTRYYISSKSYRVMMLEYEEDGIKYKRKFYNYNYAQGTLVPYRSVLWANGKIVEETDVSTITFGQKVDEEMFKVG